HSLHGALPSSVAARPVSSEGFDIRASYRSSGIVSNYLRCWPSRRPLGPESQNRPPQLLRWAVMWCPRQDSNLRPSAPEADALSTELRGQRVQCYHRSPVPPKTTPRAIGNRLHAVCRTRFRTLKRLPSTGSECSGALHVLASGNVFPVPELVGVPLGPVRVLPAVLARVRDQP